MNRNQLAEDFAAMMAQVASENDLNCITIDLRPNGHFCAYAHRNGGGCEQGIGETLATAVNKAVIATRPMLPFEEAA